MKKYKNLIFYASVISIFSALVYLMLRLGRINLEAQLNVYGLAPKNTAWGGNFLRHITDDLAGPMAILLLQIVVILLAVRLFGWICQKIGQPTVVGEILAGVVLGPSLLAYISLRHPNFYFPIHP